MFGASCSTHIFHEYCVHVVNSAYQSFRGYKLILTKLVIKDVSSYQMIVGLRNHLRYWNSLLFSLITTYFFLEDYTNHKAMPFIPQGRLQIGQGQHGMRSCLRARITEEEEDTSTHPMNSAVTVCAQVETPLQHFLQHYKMLFQIECEWSLHRVMCLKSSHLTHEVNWVHNHILTDQTPVLWCILLACVEAGEKRRSAAQSATSVLSVMAYEPWNYSRHGNWWYHYVLLAGLPHHVQQEWYHRQMNGREAEMINGIVIATYYLGKTFGFSRSLSTSALSFSTYTVSSIVHNLPWNNTSSFVLKDPNCVKYQYKRQHRLRSHRNGIHVTEITSYSQ